MVAARLSEDENTTRSEGNPHSTLTLLDLPSEIIDKICDTIGYHVYARNLSYTCTTLRYPAQRRIFKKIRLMNKEQANHLNTRFDSNPLLPNMIRHLGLCTIGVLPKHTEEESAIAMQSMCAFLDKLSRLQSFALGSLPRSITTWGDTPKEFQVALRDLFRRCEDLEQIEFTYLKQLPPNLFDDCAGLRQLAIRHNMGDPPVKKSAVFARRVHRLNSFKITRERSPDGDDDDSEEDMDSQFLHGHPILTYCTSQNGLDLTNLQSLDIVLDYCLADLSGILGVCASSLKHLKITTNGYKLPHPDFTINLSMLTSLQTLRLYLHELPICLYPQYVSTLAPPPSLHSITIGTQLSDENHTARALHHLPGLVSSLHALHARSLSAHGNIQVIQLFVPPIGGTPIYKRERLPQRAERYLVWPDQETEGVFEVHWRERNHNVIYNSITRSHRADAPDSSEGEEANPVH